MSKRITEAVNDGYNDAYAYLMVNNLPNGWEIDELIQKIRDESNNQGINVEFIHTEGITLLRNMVTKLVLVNGIYMIMSSI